MPRILGVLLIAAAALLFGIYAWFGLVWLLSASAKQFDARALEIAMLILAPHTTGWFIALALGAVAFVLGVLVARRRRLAWLGFAAHPRSAETLSSDASPPPRAPSD
jgi:hypothetical protein